MNIAPSDQIKSKVLLSQAKFNMSPFMGLILVVKPSFLFLGLIDLKKADDYSIVCIPGPQPISNIRGFSGKSLSIKYALRVESSSQGPALGRPLCISQNISGNLSDIGNSRNKL